MYVTDNNNNYNQICSFRLRRDTIYELERTLPYYLYIYTHFY
jgi:hypothetical protein